MKRRWNQHKMTLLILLCALCLSPATLAQDNATLQWFNGKKWLQGLALQPDPSIDKVAFKKLYDAHPDRWNKAFAYLKNTDLASLKPGKHLIMGEDVFATVTEGPLRSEASAKWENHHEYSDIHHMITGKENMGLGPVAGAAVVTPYDAQKDIGFYKVNGKFYEVNTGNFLLALPSQGHMPGIEVNGDKGPVKKIVIKIRN